MLFQQTHLGIEFDLFFFGESVPPCLEFIGVFDLPCHERTITPMEYNTNGIQDWLYPLGATLNKRREEWAITRQLLSRDIGCDPIGKLRVAIRAFPALMVIYAGILRVAMQTLLRCGSYRFRQVARFGDVDAGVMVAVKQPDGNILEPSG